MVSVLKALRAKAGKQARCRIKSQTRQDQSRIESKRRKAGKESEAGKEKESREAGRRKPPKAWRLACRVYLDKTEAKAFSLALIQALRFRKKESMNASKVEKPKLKSFDALKAHKVIREALPCPKDKR